MPNIGQVWAFRDLLVTLAVRDLRLRYKQTALGVIWVVLQPLAAAGIFSVVFGMIAKLPGGGVPYFLFAYAGLLGWNAFATTLGKASAALVGNAQLVSKVFFPRLVLPLSTVLSTLVDLAVSGAVLAVLMFTHHIVPGPGIVLLPVMILFLMMLGLGVGMLAAGLMVSYRDVQHVLPVVINLLLYASPVAYAVGAVPAHLQGWLYLNPLCGLLEAVRASVFGGPVPWQPVCYSAALSIAVFVGSLFAFRAMERRFADVI